MTKTVLTVKKIRSNQPLISYTEYMYKKGKLN